MSTIESTATPLSTRLLQGIVRLGRFCVFLCTAGWLFPHVCTEKMDLTRIQDEHAGRSQ